MTASGPQQWDSSTDAGDYSMLTWVQRQESTMFPKQKFDVWVWFFGFLLDK